MKRVFCIITTIAFSLATASFAGSSDKEFKKILEKHDVPPEAKVSYNHNPYLYWDALLNINDQLFKFANDMQKMKGAEKEAYAELAKIPRFNEEHNPSIYYELQGFCDTLLMTMGISGNSLNCSLHIVLDDRVNAYTALTNDGFAMCITSGFFTKSECTYEILMAAVAHEFAHGAYFHHLQSLYAEAKAKRKNRLLGGIAMGLEALSAGADAYASAYTGQKYDNSLHARNIERIERNIETENTLFSFKFSREQEFEADIVAYRFLQWIGEEHAYIELLNFLGTDYDFLYDEYSDHPTTTARIGLIKYMQDHPEINNKEIVKLRKKANKNKKNK